MPAAAISAFEEAKALLSAAERQHEAARCAKYLAERELAEAQQRFAEAAADLAAFIGERVSAGRSGGHAPGP